MRHPIKGLLQACALLGLAVSAPASAIVCELTNYTVEAYDHRGIYLHGMFGTSPVSHLAICGVTGTGAQDCDSRASDRMLAIALSAQAQGKPLLVYMRDLNTCTVPNYTFASSLRLAP